jgi:hypothetical protein
MRRRGFLFHRDEKESHGAASATGKQRIAIRATKSANKIKKEQFDTSENQPGSHNPTSIGSSACHVSRS